MIGVYFLTDRHDRPIYIGASRDVDRRATEHRSKSWWGDVAHVDIYEMKTWEQALYVERHLIRHCNPEQNVQSTDRDEAFRNRINGTLLRWAEEVTA